VTLRTEDPVLLVHGSDLNYAQSASDSVDVSFLFSFLLIYHKLPEREHLRLVVFMALNFPASGICAQFCAGLALGSLSGLKVRELLVNFIGNLLLGV
jgi:hypothetical protein